ncbi:ribonuclease H family protein [Lentibacillus sp. CBA3610]|uniref:ribonuclease H family protein n=1 Tax=Lentibacillus sp. CBA3610 TaxID=2518176 RepID=UPI0015957C76|nr:ribonuclease H family protein [Lentibacillus sp. CBA3610]QKY70083.1 reverse transcriptase-like protein [Lentibacillus sp. CBA3610]
MKFRIELTYTTPKGTETFFSSDEMPAAKALLLAEDLEKTGRARQLIFIDQYDSEWTVKELTKQMEAIQTEPHDVTVYFDGGFDRETKKSGLGCAVYYEQNGKSWRQRKNALVDELETNNEAEYAALHLAIQELEVLGVHHLTIAFAGDSQVVINQLKGDWPCYEAALNQWADRIEHDLERLGIEPEYEVISRKNNQEADRLASQALKGVEVTSTIEL